MKIQYRTLLIASLLIFCGSCDKDSDSNFEKINTVTGIAFTDENGAALGLWQFPNEKETDIIALYPNPAIDVITLSSQEALKNVWIILGDCEGEDIGEEIIQMSQSLNYEVSDIEARQILTFGETELSSNTLSINLSDLDEGFYRMFFEATTGEVFWKNFYKTNTAMPGINWSAELDEICE